jgi:3-phosphoshikimate 1-carboxyvinyltransferase
MMALPDLIEIQPLAAPVRAKVAVPGSKSITNRALVRAALAEGECMLRGALWSEDTQVMVDALRDLGFLVQETADAFESGNRTVTIYGQGGRIPRGGTASQPLELFVGNAGTAARFLAALVCLGSGVYRLHGTPRMHERPQQALFEALRRLGYRIDSPNHKLPALIHGGGPRPAAGPVPVSIRESSQFASALLLCADYGEWSVQVVDENADESPYVVMTSRLNQAFPRAGGVFQIEPDASSGSYFWAAQEISNWKFNISDAIRVAHWPTSGWQIDEAFPRFLPLPPVISRQRDLGDSIMTAIVLAPLGGCPVAFADLGRLRLQECERVAALRTELTKCGATVVERGDTLQVFPSALHGAEIETYHDHRMAMCFAVLGLAVPRIRIRNPACVNKTFPNFFQKLAAPPPAGLGVVVLDAGGRRPLVAAELATEPRDSL